MEATQKAHPILMCLLKTCQKYKKDYCFPSQEKIIHNMGSYGAVKKSRATLNRWLRIIEDKKYLIRRRRIKRDSHGGMIFKSTLYKITIKGYYLLQKFGVDCTKEIAAFQAKMRSRARRPEGKNYKNGVLTNGRGKRFVELVNKAFKNTLGNLLTSL